MCHSIFIRYCKGSLFPYGILCRVTTAKLVSFQSLIPSESSSRADVEVVLSAKIIGRMHGRLLENSNLYQCVYRIYGKHMQFSLPLPFESKF